MSKNQFKIKHQRVIKGQTRRQRSAYLIQAVDREVERTALKFKMSKSFVIAHALAHTFGISVERVVALEEAERRTRQRNLKREGSYLLYKVK